MKKFFAVIAMLAGMVALGAGAATVKVTPLGSHDGEFCARDRAIVFEDPDGTRILYDAGFTVRGTDDPRLGKIDAVLLSHVHGDHLGPAHQPAANAGSLWQPAILRQRHAPLQYREDRRRQEGETDGRRRTEFLLRAQGESGRR